MNKIDELLALLMALANAAPPAQTPLAYAPNTDEPRHTLPDQAPIPVVNTAAQPGWCAGCNPDNCPGCGPGADCGAATEDAFAPPPPSWESQ